MNYIRISLLMLLFLSILPFCAAQSPEHGNTINADMARSPYQPVVHADHSQYSEETGLYTLTGNVSIKCRDFVITTDTARINANTLQIWADGHALITEGELCFSGDALYAELTENTAWFFGTRCGCERPGLAIHGDTIRYNWQSHIVVFDGHVLWVQNGKNHTTSHLEFDLNKNDIVR